MNSKKISQICLCRKYQVFECIFLLFYLSHVSIASNQTCVFIKNYDLCYFTNISQIHITKCQSSSCLQYSTDHDECLNFTLESLSESECIKKLCGSNNLKLCIDRKGDLVDQENEENQQNRLMRVCFGVGGSFFCLALIIFVLRKVKCKKGLHQNVQIGNFSSNINLNLHESTQAFQTIDISKPNVRIKTFQSINSISLSSFVHESCSDPNTNAINRLCCICLESDKINCETVCGHFYHLNCLAQWLQRKKQCPQCRSKMFAPIKAI